MTEQTFEALDIDFYEVQAFKPLLFSDGIDGPD